MLLFKERKRTELQNIDGVSDMVQALLASRGISTAKEAEAFLNPSIDRICDPFEISGMDKAVTRLKLAVENKERIMIYGDYDVDGVTATAALVSYFRSLGAKVDYYIPSRHEEGYGLNVEAVRKIADAADICVTVDCGITSVAEADLAKSLGLPLIVTDHHKPGDKLPECEVIVSALLGGPFDKFAGVGIAVMLVYAMGGRGALMEVIDLAALGTVADIVPLVGENRIITSAGIAKINESTRPGIRALMNVIKSAETEIDAAHIAFFISPRINAGGRMGSSNRSVELLLTDDESIAMEIAISLNNENQVRQEVEARILNEVEELIRQNVDFVNDRAIILMGKWNQGVVGLVASRIVERYHFPTILLCETCDEQCADDAYCESSGDIVENAQDVLTGSARSIPGINLHAALMPFSELFIRFGGHEQAAGLTMEKRNFETFVKGFNQSLRESVPQEVYVPRSMYDLTISLNRLNPRLVNELKRLQPTGYGNPSPIFRASPVDIINPRKVGAKQNHLKLSLGEEDTYVDAIAFKMGYLADNMSDSMDVLFTPGLNVWNGKVSVQCDVRAMRPSHDIADFSGVCGRTAAEKLAASLESRLMRHNKETGARDITVVTDEEEADRIINDGIREILGTLFIAYTPEAIADITATLSISEKGKYISLNFGTIASDVRAFTSVCFAPRWDCEMTHYRHVVLLDCDWGDTVREYDIFPKARFSVISTEKARRYAQTLSTRLMPSKDALRILYVSIRDMSAGVPVGINTLSRSVIGIPGLGTKPQLISALCVLSELELISCVKSETGTIISALKSRKCDPADSRFLQTLQTLSESK